MNISTELDKMDTYPAVTVVYATGYAILAVIGSFGKTLLYEQVEYLTSWR